MGWMSECCICFEAEGRLSPLCGTCNAVIHDACLAQMVAHGHMQCPMCRAGLTIALADDVSTESSDHLLPAQAAQQRTVVARDVASQLARDGEERGRGGSRQHTQPELLVEVSVHELVQEIRRRNAVVPRTPRRVRIRHLPARPPRHRTRNASLIFVMRTILLGMMLFVVHEHCQRAWPAARGY